MSLTVSLLPDNNLKRHELPQRWRIIVSQHQLPNLLAKKVLTPLTYPISWRIITSNDTNLPNILADNSLKRQWLTQFPGE